MRVRVGDVIKPAVPRHNVAYREFFNSIKFHVKYKLPYNFGPQDAEIDLKSTILLSDA